VARAPALAASKKTPGGIFHVVFYLTGAQVVKLSKKVRSRPISFFVRGFLQQAEDILDVAASGDSTLQDVVIVMDRQGGMRMLDPSGWSLPALSAEYGATAVYKVEKRGSTVRVEGWDGCERCLIQRSLSSAKLFQLPGMGCCNYRPAMMLLPA
jgi:hypothetical protein